MDTDKAIKKELIEYIKANDTSFADIDLDNYSVTQLIIIKVGIETIIKDAAKKTN